MTTVAERHPAYAPWEKHPDPRRNVSHILCGPTVAATTSTPLAVALTRAVLDKEENR